MDRPGLTDVDAQELIEFGASAAPGSVGIHGLRMVLHRKVHWRFTKSNLALEKDRQYANVYPLIELMNSNAVFTIVRKAASVNASLDAHWKHQFRTAVDKKICPLFSEQVDDAMAYLFRKLVQDPTKKLDHQPWMVQPNEPMSVAAFNVYASHAARRKFDSGRHWEIILSAALVREISYENMCLAKYFAFGIEHEATVIMRRGIYAQVEVTVLPLSEHIAMPAIAPNTSMKLRVGDLIVAKDDMDEDISVPAPENAEMEGDTQVFSGYEYRAKVLAKETSKSFVVSLNLDKTDREANAKFKLNNRINIQLEMKRNNLPSSRQMQAIGIIANAETDRNLSKDDKTFSGYLRNFLLGEGAPDLRGTDVQSPIDAKYWGLPDSLQNAFYEYAYRIPFNKEQEAAWNSIFKSTSMMAQVQDLPGTGKPHLNVTVATCFALLGYNTVITAPKNKACEETIKGLAAEVAILYKKFPEERRRAKLCTSPLQMRTCRQSTSTSRRGGSQEALESTAATVETRRTRHHLHPIDDSSSMSKVRNPLAWKARHPRSITPIL